jgi:hypothetical protein
LKKPPVTYKLENAAKVKNTATERDWYDNFIESGNIIYEEPAKKNKYQVQ